jgi:hypothetical protein
MSEPALFVDETSVIISGRRLGDFCSVSNLVLCHIIRWFADNKLVLNQDKTNIMRFITSVTPHSALRIGCKEKCIEETENIKFLHLQIDNHLNWKNHVEQMIPKWSMLYTYIDSTYHKHYHSQINLFHLLSFLL